MPANAIKTEKDEEKWAECKKSVKKAHPDYEGKRFYKAVMGCVKVRKENTGESFDEEIFVKMMKEEITGSYLGEVTEVRKSRGGSIKLVGEVATPQEPKIYGMPKYEVEEAVRALEQAAVLKGSEDPRQKKIYEAALKVIADKRKVL